MLFQTSDTTWQAYNSYGGNSLYVGQPAGRAYKVSYNRPFNTRDLTPEDWVFNGEYPMVRWLEANGYDVSYFTGVDSDRLGAEILEHKVFLSVGHDEYWSGNQRTNVEAARDAGISLAFFSGNEIFWKTRWENSIDSSNTPYRTLVSYKETHANEKIDPLPDVWTGTWRDPRFSPPADGGRPENALSGTIFKVNNGTFAITVPEADGKMRFWRNTSVASLQPGQTATLSDFTLGYEWDEEPENGFRPAGLIRLSTTNVNNAEILLDYGSTYGVGTATHNLTMYRNPSGALVFGAGTIQWSWGLDGNHDRLSSTPDQRMQQATVNLFADMGVQPGTLQGGLLAAQQSTDTTAPVSTIGSPTNGASVQTGTAVLISGTASDVGGRVGGVEVSVDAGLTWHRANGRASWSYSWTPSVLGQVNIISRAIDDSGNIEVASSQVIVNVTDTPDTQPPTVAVTEPLNGATVVSTVAVSADASDNYGVQGVQFLLDGANLGAEDIVPPYTINWNTTNSLNGSHVIEARARDAAGNTALSSPITVNVNNPSDTTPPTVLAVSPTSGAIDVAVNTTLTVQFSEAIDPTTISSNTFELRDGANNLISAAVSYDTATQTATLVPATSLSNATLYSATVKGGSTDPRVKDLTGNALANDYIWSFTTVAGSGANCPCTIWASSATPSVASENDPSAIEVGVKFRADSDGFISGIRFYKGANNTGTHIGNLWTSNGILLATATFTNEAASGWQQVNFASPVQISANITYIASYHTDVGYYALDNNYFATSGVDNAPLHALADGVDGGNGVYSYGTSAFPTSSYNASNYWVDVVYSPSTGPDTTPPVVLSVTPANGAVGINPNSNVAVTFNEAVDPTTINQNTFEFRDGSGNLVSGVLSYDSASRTATVNPDSALANSATYTARVIGGTTDPRVKDLAGNALANDYTWSFTTADPVPPPPDDGPGGPILVISSAANPFSRYYGEILRAEGFNEFLVTDISNVSATTLSGYRVVILGEMALGSSQVTMLTDWVTAGGNLIAMRPDKQLANLLGLTDTSATISNGYLKVDTTTAPGNGIVSDSIQFHGSADSYTLNGATSVAALYSNATTATPYPAVTLRSVGTNGGQVAAFTFDLARSVVYTRQGNPAWAGQDRDGLPPIRSDDMFYPDWIDLNKVPIPQADEQQRLLGNLILNMNFDQMPLPRFWYFPKGLKAVVVMTGDDHSNGSGTSGRFDQYDFISPAGCSVNDWECIRGTSYIYPESGLTDSQLAAYVAKGFEIAVHINTGCVDYTPTSLDSNFSSQLSTFQTNFPSVPAPTTNRTHCIVWSDWATQAKVENQYGIRLDTDYYYFPGSWVNDRPGFFTGSGMPMRFADTDGTLIDVYQATTQMTDESGQTYPFTIDSLLDKAIGPEGFYGAFTANMHTDVADSGGSDAIIASAQARGVPVVTSRQMLNWLDGRNNSSFSSLAWNGTTLSFTITPGQTANNLRAMLPIQTVAGAITSISYNGTPINFTTETIKGITYAMFPAAQGTYQASTTPLPPDTTPPTVTITSPTDGTTISGTVTVSANATDNVTVAGVQFQLNGTNLGAEDTVAPYSIPWNTASVPNGTYQLTAIARDAASNLATSPAVNVTVDNIPDTTPPTITTVNPAAGSVDVATDIVLTASFSEAVDPASITATTFELRDGGGTLVPAAISYDAGTKTASLTPSSPLTSSTSYTALLKGGTTDPRVKDLAGNALTSDYTWSFSTAVPSPYSSIWALTATPTAASSTDANPIEVGVKFQSNVDGYITGIRFYKGINNTGTHIGNLWSNTGTLLETATFVSETASGWQQVNFATPVAITANTTYVASYHTDVGFYALDENYFATSGIDNPPLRALANGVDGGNGIYQYGASGFPTSSFNASNYWVDVVFATNVTPDTTPPTVAITAPTSGAVITGTVPVTASASDNVAVAGVQFQLNGANLGAEDLFAPYTTTWDTTMAVNGTYQLTAIARDGAGNTTTSTAASVTVNNVSDTTLPTVIGVTPIAGATGVPANTVLTVSFSEAMDPATIVSSTIELWDGASNLVSAAVSYDAASQQATLTPSAPLAYSTGFTAMVRGGATDPRVKDLAGNALASDYTWSFTSMAPPCSGAPCSIWEVTSVPTTTSVSDTGAIEVGVKFQSDVDGYITGIRFYKGIDNTGTHIGNLWSNTGTLLGTATFISETASGWQQVSFGAPVPITANTTYVASYHTDMGRYAGDNNYFATAGVDNPPLRALANGVDGGNGVYQYGPTGFPASSFNASNYWVDVVFATTITPDTTPPTVAITAPTSGAVITGTVTVTASASDNVAVAGVQFQLNGASLGAEDSLPPYTLNWDSTTVPDGAYQLTAIARDGAGNSTSSLAVDVTVDNVIEDTTPPTVVGVAPATGATDVPVDTVLTVSFSEAMDPATIVSNTIELRDEANNLVSAAVSYDAASQQATLIPSTPLAYSTAYTGLVRGGATDPRVKDLAGNALASDYTWSFNSTASPCSDAPCSIWDATSVPTTASVSDTGSIEVGVKFQSDVNGYITGVRFYKGIDNTGTHIGNLWSSTGTLLGTATFISETASGWQQVNFATPMAITANTTYVASYHTDVGRYAGDSNYFATAGVDNPPLRALANGIDGGNGVYQYGPTGFPNSSFNASNYWVDVVFATFIAPDTTPPTVTITAPTSGAVITGTVAVTASASDDVAVAGVQFQLNGANLGAEDSLPPYTLNWDSTTVPDGAYQLTAIARDGADNTATSLAIDVTVDNVIEDTTPPTVVGVAPATGATDVPVDMVLTVSFSEAMDPATIISSTIELRDGSGTLVPAVVNYDAGTHTATLTPTSPLANSTFYTALVRGGASDPRVKDLTGNPLANDYTWSFTTLAAIGSNCPCSIWDASATPTRPSVNDQSAIEVGVKFQADVDGYITSIRFYKGVDNTGTHIGNLWTNAGTLLATAIFVSETASGWQQVSFATPVLITANTTYVASYHTDVGRYAGDNNYFATAGVDNPPLRALANGVDGGNGVYQYGPTGFPASSYKASNYWVDVVFATTVTPDTTPPTVAITAPTSGAVITGTVPVTASASDDVAVAGVQFQLNGASLGVEDTLPPYTLNWDSTTVPDGAYQLTAIARDGAGNSTSSLAVDVTVDNVIEDTTPPTVVGAAPATGATDVPVDTVLTVSFSEAMDPATIISSTIELRDGGGTLVPAAANYDAGTHTATLTPTSPLANSTFYTALVRGGATDPRVKDLAGNALASDYTWSFTTMAAIGSNCPCSIWDAASTPANPSSNDKKAIEVGVKFQSDIDGYITSIRFYKGINNTGTHIGNLWTSTEILLASATFTNETASGWQQVDFATPVAITANTTYVASYHTDVGRYAGDNNYFTTEVYIQPLRALANGVDGGNGVYQYGPTGFPTSSFKSSNYWVDVVFTTNP